jgi:hypothetical protein
VRPAAILTCLALFVACSQPTAGRDNSAAGARLAPASGAYREIHTTAVFALPDSGGFLVNGAPLDSLGIEPLLDALFATRAPDRRAAFVRDNPHRRAAVHWIRQAAERAGGRAFDAELSGWPRSNPGPLP